MEFILEKRIAHRAVVGGKNILIFSSNDYLGLSAHPEVLRAASEAASRYGAGTGGAPGTTGTTQIHIELAAAVASFQSRKNAVLFPSGYQANQALHQALDSDRTIFYIDNRHHPSAIDGVKLAKNSRIVRFDHNNLDALKGAILAHRGMVNIVSIPSVFTVDGDIAPLDKLYEMKQKLGFLLIFDEAHATGCLGKTGRGIEEHFNLIGVADFIMGTFSKSLGSQGGFLAYNDDAAKYLHAHFRTLEYSTSLSTLSAAAALKALQLLENDPTLLMSLHHVKRALIENCQALDIPLISKESMIMLLPNDNCDALQARLFEAGFLTIVVKAQLATGLLHCLRIIPMATHTDSEIKSFVQAIKANL
jgi:7-keto-8-aminopelargonate synthetase-like enzyme